MQRDGCDDELEQLARWVLGFDAGGEVEVCKELFEDEEEKEGEGKVTEKVERGRESRALGLAEREKVLGRREGGVGDNGGGGEVGAEGREVGGGGGEEGERGVDVE